MHHALAIQLVHLLPHREAKERADLRALAGDVQARLAVELASRGSGPGFFVSGWVWYLVVCVGCLQIGAAEAGRFLFLILVQARPGGAQLASRGGTSQH